MSTSLHRQGMPGPHQSGCLSGCGCRGTSPSRLPIIYLLTGPTKQAINWAIGEEVNADIISMSWTISEFEANNIKLKDRLLDTLSTAANKRIIFAATGDRGLTAPS